MELAVGVEPTTYRLQGDCSAKLSYTSVVTAKGVEPLYSTVKGWWLYPFCLRGD